MDLKDKSTVEEIRKRFDNDVERFSVLATGQSSTVDAPLVLELISSAAAAHKADSKSLLDIGCGAGNYTLKLLEKRPLTSVTLIDLSRPMLERAVERISADHMLNIEPLQGDIREIELGEERFDIVFAAAVLHHLRTDDEWESVFRKIYRALKPGGSFWISDLILHNQQAINELMWLRYRNYLTELKDKAYQEQVFAYVEKEDSPKPLLYQIDLLRSVGFSDVDILHKNAIFAAFCGVK